MKKVISYCLLILLLLSCSKDTALVPEEYVHYLEKPENGYRKQVITGGASYVIQIATPEYMAIKELADEQGNVDAKSLEARSKELSGNIFFIIQLGQKAGVTDPATAERMVGYYQQAAAADISLHTGGTQQLTPVAYNFENNYGLTGYNTITVAFELPEQNTKDLAIVFNDRFRDNYMIRAGFSKDIFTTHQKLKTK